MRLLSILLLITLSLQLFAQEEYRTYLENDSTVYTYNADTQIIATRYQLRYSTASGQTLIHDFSTNITDEHIRDFNIIDQDKWYVIVGGNNWGDSAVLYKTTDQGITWDIDTSYFPATRVAQNTGVVAQFYALFQMHKISSDTLVLFVSYYQSGIFYSTDGGDSWQLWFGNFISNYRGLFKCGDDYYLWGVFGDGFSGSMFKFSGNLLFSPDTNGAWTNTFNPNSYHGCPYDTLNCIQAIGIPTEQTQYQYFKNIIDSICPEVMNVSINETAFPDAGVTIFPNPSHDGKFNVQLNDDQKTYNLKVVNSMGQMIINK